jgi:hypothetical protein
MSAGPQEMCSRRDKVKPEKRVVAESERMAGSDAVKHCAAPSGHFTKLRVPSGE